MLQVWIYSLVSVFIVSLISFVGLFTLSLRIENLKKILLYLVSFSAGSLFGGAFLHLLPEIVEEHGFGMNISLAVLSGLIFFFIIEKFIHWRHCHIPTSDDHPHPFAFMNLFGDAVHNFIDGLIIGASFMMSIPAGIATTIAVALHEIPQEIGDFGVLLHGGFSKGKALLFNFLTALTAIFGVIVALILASFVENITLFLVPFAAGGFIYIAGSDLIPELNKEMGVKKSFIQLVSFILGIGVMMLFLFME
ncbi:ZIP family metal transporter [Candidatus Falkowbacteria bacterium]|jgi:zinc and cadmium transporter|nr:ZIP family metal transporter [Candidatus Falkowbacteria bacterium]MBT4432817.1 ZIP family metal transporter [Candidatus Falkowbacteria bacterium]